MISKILLSCALIIMAGPVSAEKIQKLTKNNVQDFLEYEDKLLKANAGKSNPSKVKGYLKKHLADEFVYEDTVNSTLGGFGTNTQTLKYNREDYINNVSSNISSLKGAKTALDIESIEISKSGKSAKVNYITRADLKAQDTNLSKQSKSNLPVTFGMKTVSDCESILRLSAKKQIIQTKSLTCNTEAEMEIPKNFGG